MDNLPEDCADIGWFDLAQYQKSKTIKQILAPHKHWIIRTIAIIIILIDFFSKK